MSPISSGRIHELANTYMQREGLGSLPAKISLGKNAGAVRMVARAVALQYTAGKISKREAYRVFKELEVDPTEFVEEQK